MPGFGFGKRPKPRKFDFIPRYYDPDKEELESRLAQYKDEMNEEERAKHRIRTGLRNKYYGDSVKRSCPNCGHVMQPPKKVQIEE